MVRLIFVQPCLVKFYEEGVFTIKSFDCKHSFLVKFDDLRII